MSSDLIIPAVGESITEVQISEWLKNEGDTLQKDEPVAVIESEKTTFELPAPLDGTLSKILHRAGEVVKVGDIIGQIEPGGAQEIPGKANVSAAQAKPQKAKPGAVAKPGPAAETSPSPPAANVETGPIAAPPPQVKRSEAGDRQASITKKAGDEKSPDAEMPPSEIKQSAAAAPVPTSSIDRTAQAYRSTVTDGSDEVVPMTMLRRTIARRLVEAKQSMAMLTTFNEVDMSSVQALRREFQEIFREKHGIKLGLMSFFVRAALEGFKQFPQLNSEIQGDNIVIHKQFDIGIAIAVDRGLVVPVLRGAENLSFASIEKAIADLTQSAKTDALKPEDLSGGTFTITNGGVFGSMLSTPIINPPQSAILGLHAIEERPIARSGTVIIAPMMYLALTYDHRIVDGREGVLFLRRIKEVIESPSRLLLEV